MKTVVNELAPLKGYNGIPSSTKAAAAAAAMNAKRRPIVTGAVSICIAVTLIFFGCNFTHRSSPPAAAIEAMTGSSPPTFPPDIQCGIDICNNSGHDRSYLFIGDECQDLNPPKDANYLIACYLEYKYDCIGIWNDLDDPYNSHLDSFASSDLVQCIGYGIPIGDECSISETVTTATLSEYCVIPPGLTHGVCRNSNMNWSDKDKYRCQSGQPGSYCGLTDDCVVPPGLDHAVCRHGKCQR